MRRKKTSSVEQIIDDFDEHIHKCGGNYSDWYIGTASNPSNSLFNNHNVTKNKDAWIYHNCGSDRIARKVKEFFLRKGCDGRTGGSDKSTRYVYAYKKHIHTSP